MGIALHCIIWIQIFSLICIYSNALPPKIVQKPTSKPLQKPTIKITQKPTIKITEKPTSKPANLTTQKPANQITQKPANTARKLANQTTQKPANQTTQKPANQTTQKPANQTTQKPENQTKYTNDTKQYKPVNRTLRWTSAAFQKEVLAKINEFRKDHNAEPLVVDSDLSWDAEEYARKVGERCETTGVVRPYYGRPKLTGENVWVSDNQTKIKQNFTGDIPVKFWYNEGKKHNFSNNVYSTKTAQFTQLIWKDTKRIGVGLFISQVKKFYIVVCRFKPNGNWRYVKTFAMNVEPVKSTAKVGRSFDIFNANDSTTEIDTDTTMNIPEPDTTTNIPEPDTITDIPTTNIPDREYIPFQFYRSRNSNINAYHF